MLVRWANLGHYIPLICNLPSVLRKMQNPISSSQSFTLATVLRHTYCNRFISIPTATLYAGKWSAFWRATNVALTTLKLSLLDRRYPHRKHVKLQNGNSWILLYTFQSSTRSPFKKQAKHSGCVSISQLI